MLAICLQFGKKILTPFMIGEIIRRKNLLAALTTKAPTSKTNDQTYQTDISKLMSRLRRRWRSDMNRDGERGDTDLSL